MSLLGEIKRRKVFQVAAVYAVVAWLIMQIIDVVASPLSLPGWVATVVIVLLAVGFPVAVILAWAFDLTPRGLKPDPEVQLAGGISSALPEQRLTFIIQGLVLVAVGFLVLDQYVFEPGTRTVAAGQSSDEDRMDSTRPVRRYVTSLGSTQAIGNTGLSAHLAISPAGTHVAYAVQRVDATPQLFIRALDQLEARLLPETLGATHPFFSPDGEWVGFYSDEDDDKLKKVSVESGETQILANAPWAAGGSWGTSDSIVFSTQDSYFDRSIFRLPATGGTLDVLIPSDPDEQGYIWPDVLPNGKGILYAERPVGGTASGGRVKVLSLQTGESRVLIEGAYRPRYAPTGHVVFSRSASVWAVPFDVDRLQKTGPEALILKGIQSDGVLGGVAYAFSDEGTLVYVPGGDVTGLRRLAWLDRQGREEQLNYDPRTFLDLSISPDGQYVAAAVTGNGNSDIWVGDLTRGTLSRLTSHPGADLSPLWTVDGKRVIFASYRNGYGLFSKAADGTGAVERLTKSEGRQWPEAFAPDGSLVFRENIGEASALFLLPPGDNRTPQSLLQTPFNDTRTAISPDGRWIAYTSDETGRAEIYVRPFPNVQEGKYPVSLDGGSDPRWVSGGDELTYVVTDDTTMMVVPVERAPDFIAGTPTVLTRLEGWVANTTSGYDITSSGSRFLVMKAVDGSEDLDRETQLIVIENWFEELKRLASPSE